MVAVAKAATGLAEGIEVICRLGYTGELGGDFGEYGRWLGKRHRARVWGEYFSNVMVVGMRVMLLLGG